MNTIHSYFKKSSSPVASSSNSTPAITDAQFGLSDITESYYRRGYLGYSTSLMKSGLQKQIRRGDWLQAYRWAMLLLGGYSIENLWNRILTICSEDISIGNEFVLETVYRNHCEYLRIRKETDKRPDVIVEATSKRVKAWRRDLRNDPEIRYGLLETIWVMCQAKKTRICDHINGSILKRALEGKTSINKSMKRNDLYESILEGLRVCWHGKTVESEMELLERVALYLSTSIGTSKYNDMMKILNDCARLSREVGDRKRELWVFYLSHCFEQRNKGSSKTVKGNTNLMNAVLLFTREEIGYEPMEIPKSFLMETIENEFQTLIGDPTDFVLNDEDFLHDKHVGGSRKGKSKEEMTLDFYGVEYEALTPKFECEDPYYQIALREFGGEVVDDSD